MKGTVSFGEIAIGYLREIGIKLLIAFAGACACVLLVLLVEARHAYESAGWSVEASQLARAAETVSGRGLEDSRIPETFASELAAREFIASFLELRVAESLSVRGSGDPTATTLEARRTAAELDSLLAQREQVQFAIRREAARASARTIDVTRIKTEQKLLPEAFLRPDSELFVVYQMLWYASLLMVISAVAYFVLSGFLALTLDDAAEAWKKKVHEWLAKGPSLARGVPVRQLMVSLAAGGMMTAGAAAAAAPVSIDPHVSGSLSFPRLAAGETAAGETAAGETVVHLPVLHQEVNLDQRTLTQIESIIGTFFDSPAEVRLGPEDRAQAERLARSVADAVAQEGDRIREHLSNVAAVQQLESRATRGWSGLTQASIVDRISDFEAKETDFRSASLAENVRRDGRSVVRRVWPANYRSGPASAAVFRAWASFHMPQNSREAEALAAAIERTTGRSQRDGQSYLDLLESEIAAEHRELVTEYKDVLLEIARLPRW